MAEASFDSKDNNWRGLLEEKTKCDKKFLKDISRICFEFSKTSDKGILRELSKRVFEKNDADKAFLAEIDRSFVEKDVVIAEMYMDLKRITDNRAHGDEKTGQIERKKNNSSKRQRAAKRRKVGESAGPISPSTADSGNPFLTAHQVVEQRPLDREIVPHDEFHRLLVQNYEVTDNYSDYVRFQDIWKDVFTGEDGKGILKDEKGVKMDYRTFCSKLKSTSGIQADNKPVNGVKVVRCFKKKSQNNDDLL